MDINLFKLIIGDYNNPNVKDFVPDFAYSPLNIIGKLYYPVVDEYWLNKGGFKPIWPNNKPYAVCITHDIDHVSRYNILQNFETITKAVKTMTRGRMKKNLSMGVDSFLNVFCGLTKSSDPYSNLDLIYNVEKRSNIRSTLFFPPEKVEKRHYSDCVYRFRDKITFYDKKICIEEIVKIFKRDGFEIGLHSQWYALDSIDDFLKEKTQLENLLNENILSHRAHFLRFDNKRSPEIYKRAGILYDSTLGFNDNIGFRRGTSYPFYLYDINNNKKLDVLEIPLIIQDSAMFVKTKGMRIEREMALRYIYEIKERVKNTGGVLTVLWHPHEMRNEEYYLTFMDMIKMLKEDDPWFGTMSEIGEWWKKEVKIDLVEFLRDNFDGGRINEGKE